MSRKLNIIKSIIREKSPVDTPDKAGAKEFDKASKQTPKGKSPKVIGKASSKKPASPVAGDKELKKAAKSTKKANIIKAAGNASSVAPVKTNSDLGVQEALNEKSILPDKLRINGAQAEISASKWADGVTALDPVLGKQAVKLYMDFANKRLPLQMKLEKMLAKAGTIKVKENLDEAREFNTSSEAEVFMDKILSMLEDPRMRHWANETKNNFRTKRNPHKDLDAAIKSYKTYIQTLLDAE